MHAAASEVTYPGRRIALMIDASDSMRSDFTAPTLNAEGTQQAFFTTVAAATRFVELRRAGKYRDLMALIEFGNRSYVITPFTNDYDNLLLSMALIGDNAEFSKFPDPGTVIGSALEQSVAIFKAFDFLDASGNAMVIFTDGEDTAAMVTAVDRTSSSRSPPATSPSISCRISTTRTTTGIADRLWKEGVEQAGGRFYVARDETTCSRPLRTSIATPPAPSGSAMRHAGAAVRELCARRGGAVGLRGPDATHALCSTLP
jgi:hypothetical protein